MTNDPSATSATRPDTATIQPMSEASRARAASILIRQMGTVGPRSPSVKLNFLRYDRPDMETVTLTIDGRQVTVNKGKTVLQAAIEAGISVPYYCYHPGISVDGSCRVCVVKIEKMPKLQTSCSMVCTEGMVVST